LDISDSKYNSNQLIIVDNAVDRNSNCLIRFQ